MFDDSRSAIAVGCAVGVVASAMQSVGLTLQRKAHIMEDSLPSARPLYKRGVWRLGFLLFIIANVFGSSVQIGTLPLIVLSPLQAIGLVFNSIFAAVMLNEPFSHTSLAGTALVGFGAFFIAFFGAIPEPRHSLDDLLLLLHRTPFLIWMVITIGLSLSLLVFLLVRPLQDGAMQREISKSSTQDPSREDASSGAESMTRSEATRAMIPVGQAWYDCSLGRGSLFGVISGVLSAHSLLMAKSAVEICIRGYSTGFQDFQRYQTWLIVLGFIFFALSQLYVLNLGLAICSTTVLYPLVFCVYNVTSILNGLVYFNQASLMNSLQIVWVFFGTMLVLLGVFALSWRSAEEERLEEDRAPLLENNTLRMAINESNYLATEQQAMESDSYTSFTYGSDPGSPFTAAASKNRARRLTLERSSPTEADKQAVAQSQE